MKKIKKIFFIIIILINISILSFAHPGRTDSNGGHYNRKTGEYHYHDGRYAGQSQSITFEDDKENETTTTHFNNENITSQTYSPSLKNSLLQNKTASTTTTIKNSEKKEVDFWYILGYIYLFIFFGVPILLTICSYIVGIIEIIKDMFSKNKPNENQQTTHIYSTDYTVSSNTTQIETNKPIIKTQNNYICPKCGGQLQIKNGKYGKFIGCKNYPNCKYTKNLKRK